MAEHQDLSILGRLRLGEQGDPAEITKKDQVEHAYGHRSHPAGDHEPQIRPCDSIPGTRRYRTLRLRSPDGFDVLLEGPGE
jgi:hypothetical protein